MPRSEISLETVRQSLTPMNQRDSFLLLEHRRLEDEGRLIGKESGIFNVTGDFSDDRDDDYITTAQGNFTLTRRLKGAVTTLAKNTHVHFEQFALPRNLTEDSIRKLSLGQRQAMIALARIHFSEPGILNPIKREVTSYFTPPKVKALAAAVGVQLFLNDPYSTEDTEGFAEQIVYARSILEMIQDERADDFAKAAQQSSGEVASSTPHTYSTDRSSDVSRHNESRSSSQNNDSSSSIASAAQYNVIGGW